MQNVAVNIDVYLTSMTMTLPACVLKVITWKQTDLTVKVRKLVAAIIFNIFSIGE